MADAQAIVARALGEGPRVGFGTGDLFIDGRSGDAVRLVESAYEAGFRYFDTARLYGDGQAEYAVGTALQRHRDNVVIASKCGVIPWSMRTGRRIAAKAAKAVLGARGLSMVGQISARGHAFARTDIVRSVETSLRALRTDHVDILLLHGCTLADLADGSVAETVGRLREAGKLRAWGIAGHHADTLEILADGRVKPDVLQAPADAVDRQIPGYGTAPGRLLVTHSLIRPVVDALRKDAGLAERILAATGVDPGHSDLLVALLIAHGLAANPDGIVLASSRKPGRPALLYRAAADAGRMSEAVRGLEAALRR